MPRLHYKHRVMTNTGLDRYDHDFIADSDLFYYYQSNFTLDHTARDRAWAAFDLWRDQALQNMPDFSWDQFTKLPYLKQSLEREQCLRFPIIFHDDIVCCGNGRVVTVAMFFPNLPVDRIICSTQPRYDLQHLTTLQDLERVLLQRPFLSRAMRAQRCFNWHVNRGLIVAHDISRTHNTFPFCKNSQRNARLLDQVKRMVMNSHDQPVEDLLRSIALLDIRRHD